MKYVLLSLIYVIFIALLWRNYLQKRKRLRTLELLKTIHIIAIQNPNLVADYKPEMEVLEYLIGYYSKKETFSPEYEYATLLMHRTQHNMRKAQCLKYWSDTGRFSFYRSGLLPELKIQQQLN